MERAVDRTRVGDLEQPLTLPLIERSSEFDVSLDLIDASDARLALRTILCCSCQPSGIIVLVPSCIPSTIFRSPCCS